MTRTEWQVWIDKKPGTSEVHIFATQGDAIRFAQKNMVPEFSEGGMLGSKAAPIRKVVRHGHE